MAEINVAIYDKTLAEIDKALELKKKLEPPRHYLGCSEIGNPCDRYLFYSYRNADVRVFDAPGVRRVDDGHRSELVMAEWLRMLPYIELYTTDPEKPEEQIGCSFLLGHMRGHYDGIIRGVLEAPRTWHIWEHKSVNEKKFEKLKKLRLDYGEKNALGLWDEIYYAQAQLYMLAENFERHFLTVTTPGCRNYISIRTELKREFANKLIEKGKAIIFDNWIIPEKLSNDPEFFTCKYCGYHNICHGGKVPNVHCKTCRYRRSDDGGVNFCELKDEIIKEEILHVGCNEHIFNNALIPFPFLGHERYAGIYEIKNGDEHFIFANCGTTDFPEVHDYDIKAIYTSKELFDKIKNFRNIIPSTQKIVKKMNGEFQDESVQKKWEERTKLNID